MKAYRVFEQDKHGNETEVDTVFWCDNSDADEVRRSLIGHDGYDTDIIVSCGDDEVAA